MVSSSRISTAALLQVLHSARYVVSIQTPNPNRLRTSTKNHHKTITFVQNTSTCNADEVMADDLNGWDSFGFSRLGSDGEMCVDVDGNYFYYGEIGNLVMNAAECALECVNVEENSSLEKIVGFNLNCEVGKCYCLYSEKLTQREKKHSGFSSTGHGVPPTPSSGTKLDDEEMPILTWGEVDGTTPQPGMSCYALTGHATSSTGKWIDDIDDDGDGDDDDGEPPLNDDVALA
mmetsp:Transcript_19661/g.41260  ORF Transcript_19661/g.41260 Transcript_19661/m.41260 type:complete len:232 (-) Transcript_19661:206-901(-)|eukprot:CAMPEP_0171341342 /NCGR_PEP_ID=MMETSP0878-20121228/10133_1 /TAXON_ID=67004 /ORGANISM="Thalassiosira weissflogii, Strain CCMP1336" /LENGTH=231 /DNA_ID=CAMNT_0011843559 /DNA_START=70 /DNA_END=765 /DNA_ORIENTATION=-